MPPSTAHRDRLTDASAPRYEQEVHWDVRIPVRDGLELSANLWLPRPPDDAPGERFGVILEMIPYGKDSWRRNEDTARGEWLAARGLALCRLDVRGTGSSPGVALDEYTEAETLDGYDAVALVLNINTHNEESLRTLEEVRGEIAAILRTELEKERAAALGEQLLSSLRNGESIDETLLANELQWIAQTNASRDQSGLNSEVMQNVFALSAPAEGESAFSGFALANGTYIVVELQKVNRGSLAQLDAEARETMVSSYVERDGRVAFDAFLANKRNNSEITENLTPVETF